MPKYDIIKVLLKKGCKYIIIYLTPSPKGLKCAIYIGPAQKEPKITIYVEPTKKGPRHFNCMVAATK